LIFSIQPAIEVLSMFDPLPVIVGANIELKPKTYSNVGEGWKLNLHSGKPIALQGNVAYNIDVNTLRGNDQGEEFDVLGLDLRLDFNIGDLSVAASRESLQYDEKTLEALRNRLASCWREISEVLSKALDGCSAKWEAMVEARRLKDILSDSIYSILRYKGEKLKEEIDIGRSLSYIRLIGGKLHTQHRYRWIVPSPRLTVYIVDELDRKAKIKIKYDLEEGYKKLGVEPRGLAVGREDMEEVLRILGNPPWTDIKSLVEPPKPKTPRTPRSPSSPIRSFRRGKWRPYEGGSLINERGSLINPLYVDLSNIPKGVDRLVYMATNLLKEQVVGFRTTKN